MQSLMRKLIHHSIFNMLNYSNLREPKVGPYTVGGAQFAGNGGILQGTLNTSIGEEKVSSVPTPQINTATPQRGAIINSEQNPQNGSLLDFQTVMRATSKMAYDERKGKEKGIMKGQFDPSKVSGSVFKAIMDSVEGNRGQDISKVYASSVEAAKFDIEQAEKVRQNNIAQDNKKFDLIKQRVELGIDSVYIPAGTLADRNNNPGNLRYVGQAGATEGEGGFAKFNSPEDGFQALINQVNLDQSRGLTLAQFVNKYAPPTENNTNLYVQQMSQWLGVDPNVPLSSIDVQKVAEMVARKESGTQTVSASAGVAGVGIEAMARQVKNGTMTIANVPAAQRAKVASAMTTLGQEVAPEKQVELMGNVALVDKILENSDSISGLIQTGIIPGTEGAKTSNQYEQLKGLLSLDKRQLLKGQGAISDFEFKVLAQAASNIGRNMGEDDFKQALIDIRGAFTNAAGHATRVKVSKGSNSKTGELTRDEIADAIKQGYTVEYVQ